MKRSGDGYNAYQLKACMEERVLVSLFVDPENPDDFFAGFMRALNGRQAMLQAVSPFGHWDGYIVVRLCDIDMVLGEDDYSERLRRLLKARDEEPWPLSVDADEDLVHALCRASLERGFVVTLWTEDEEFAGRVTQLDDMRVTIDSLDYFGQFPEPVTLVLRDVEMASIGAEDDRIFEVLSPKPPRPR